MTEVWKKTPDYPDYEVSDLGMVRSWKNGRWGRTEKPRVMKLYKDRKGYLSTFIRNEGEKSSKIRIHQIVLEMFSGPRPEGMVACHNDGNPSNNHMGNLRWDTVQSNMADKLKHGTAQKGENAPNNRLKNQEIIEIRRLGGMGLNTSLISKMFKVSKSHVRRVIRRTRWAHI